MHPTITTVATRTNSKRRPLYCLTDLLTCFAMNMLTFPWDLENPKNNSTTISKPQCCLATGGIEQQIKGIRDTPDHYRRCHDRLH